MSKRLKLSSQFLLPEQRMEGEDRISQLPDELLVKILSVLTVREAGQTSIISSRWKTLWTSITGNLEFVDPVAISNIRGRYCLKTLEEGRKKYTRWVNKVTKSHKGGEIDGLKVCFDLDISYKSDLDSWIEFAIQKKSMNVDIILNRIRDYDDKRDDLYPFPQQVLSNLNIKFIRCLRLSRVDVSGPVFEDILSKCPILEALSVSWSETLLGGVSVSGLDLLKFIEIQNCDNLEYIQVSAANLEVLVYFGPSTTSIRILHAPKLDTLQLGGGYCVDWFPLFPEISPFFSQINLLVLDYSNCITWNIIHPKFPQLKILNYLELKLPAYDDESLLFFISLIKACPKLRKLNVEFLWITDGFYKRKVEKIELEEKESFKCLKRVEFRYFAGRTPDIELVSCILENAPNIEKILFWKLESESIPFDEYRVKRRAARECATRLANKYSPRARLVVFP